MLLGALVCLRNGQDGDAISRAILRVILGVNCSYFFLFVFADVQREEKNVEKAIREAAKRNDMGSAKVRLV